MMEEDGFIIVNMSEDEYNNYVSRNIAENMLIDDMKKYANFYTFVRNFSPVDYKIIYNKEHVSQRVMFKWRILWNSVHPENQLDTLNIFFL